MNDTDKAIAALAHLSPSRADDYDSWLKVGIALKNAGATVDIWDQWSKGSTKYKAGVCEKKWRGFSRDAQGGINVGSLVEMAREDGGRPPTGYDGEPDADLSWDSPIHGPGNASKPMVPPIPAEPAEIDLRYLESVEIPPPAADWEGDLIRYLEALYQPDEYVGYVTDAWHNEEIDKWLPTKGVSEKCSELIARIRRYPNDLGAAIGDIIPHVGAWIRPNPLDGQGVKDANVTDFRYALLECDNLELGVQLAIIRQLELPCAAILHSGKKSIHAIVRIDAEDYKQYRERVNRLYEIADRNGFDVDRQNRNPSRLSRMPGILRDGKPQYLIGLNQGQASWDEWIDHIAEIPDDGLPDIESWTWDDAVEPEQKPPLIEGILRRGHKLLLAGPSKAGKSFALLQLCVAMSEGGLWFGFKVEKGRSLYINLELDADSGTHRMWCIHQALGRERVNDMIDVWNLRGAATPLDKLVPNLIRRAKRSKYAAIIIDPIYKVLTGDENSASEMATFCNQFDLVCKELGVAVIYCHHHSKGAQGHKSSHDRSSGSGVFARDPDAILDMIQVQIGGDLRKKIINRFECDAMNKALGAKGCGPVPEDISDEADSLFEWATKNGSEEIVRGARPAARKSAMGSTGWRIEGTLREFPSFKPRLFFFRHPIHIPDDHKLLERAKANGEVAPWEDRKKEKQMKKEQEKIDAMQDFEAAYDALFEAGHSGVRKQDLAAHMGLSPSTVERRVNAHHDFSMTKGVVTRTDQTHAKRADEQ